MSTLLAVLLYLHIISSPGTYNKSLINQDNYDYQVQINQVESDPVQMQTVNSVYLPQVDQIVVIDDSIGG